MEITTRALWTLLHGMAFGGLYLLACSGALVEIYRLTHPSNAPQATTGNQRFLRVYLVVMSLLAWAAVLTGAYIVYPWYRAIPPAGAALADFPQALLRSSPSTAGWHSLGMEWKEHVAWLTPISITMATAVFLRYGSRLREHLQLRRVILAFVVVSFFAAGIASFFGAEIDDYAPARGAIHLVQGEQP